MLMPINGFGHRTFGIATSDWARYFADICADFKFLPFPERLAQTGLPQEFLDQWPYAVDGLAVWNTLNGYALTFLGIFYKDDDALLADAEAVAFYASFESQNDTPWKLPPLTLKTLASLIAELMFSVTAVHELVGSIVEYLVSPDGLPGKLSKHGNTTQPDVQSHAQALVIISLTGVRQPPLMDDYTHIFNVTGWDKSKRQSAIDACRGLQSSLMAVSRDIDERNIERECKIGRKFVAFNPAIHETSVSI